MAAAASKNNYNRRIRPLPSAALAATAAVLIVLGPWRAVTGFNIDVESAVVFQGSSRDSLFGFSVAAHLDQDTGWSVILNYNDMK
jgi:hypothetical protein